MKFLRLLVLVLGLQAIACSADPYESIPVMDKVNKPIIEIFINGDGPYKFLFDTGATHTFLSPEISSKFGDQKLKLNAKFNVFFDADNFVIKQQKVSTSTGFSRDIILVGTENLEDGKTSFFKDYDGLMGLDFFRGCDFSLNGPSKRIIVEQCKSKSSKNNIVTQAKKSLPIVDLQIGDKKVSTLLDTGFNGRGNLMIAEKSSNTHFFSRTYSASESFAWPGVKQPVKRVVFDDVKFPNGKSYDLKTVIPEVDSIYSHSDSYAGYLGWNLLRHGELDISVSATGEIKAGFNAKQGLPLEYNRNGIMSFATGKDGKVYIYKIAKGSPADKAGLLPKDHIITYNDKPLKKITREVQMPVATAAPGTPFKISIMRNEQLMDFEFELQDYLVPQ